MIAKDVNAYHARTRFDTNGSISWGDTIWCFERAGATLTQLPDGREVRIGGEHEDFYDPDFCIYNGTSLVFTFQLENPSFPPRGADSPQSLPSIYPNTWFNMKQT